MWFQKDMLSVRKVVEQDIPLLAQWLSDERVLYFYEGRDQPYDEDRVRKEYLTRQEGETIDYGIAEWEETPIGLIQIYKLDKDSMRKYGYPPDVSVWGMDQFIGEPDYWNRGIGTRLVQSAVKYLTGEKGAQIVVMDPQVRNSRAIRCYEKCGFQKVQMLPRHEKHEGVWQNCWLMEYDKEAPGEDV
ncbi:GNAT family N-acetyltransferase [Desmospora profundinema]|uniref:Aminoglycoside 6'-N-acetyltransferase n=1 Tax=Desmospora profundinema TaxID=1571184 RepID=A0ABU1IRM9_9BACL|nr:GNAT family N-acetyltransferase [Desmospora profundinema]MDR6227212.1 aminoglycoside 6'-N-acetyltransferase [Desmospora profundinema]